MREKLKKLFTNQMSPVGIIGTTVVFLFAMHFFTEPPSNNTVRSTVMITRPDNRSGGTGVVLESTKNRSTVLTNSHVCKIIEKGGFVTGMAGVNLVASYKHSTQHDLCLITVNANLGANTVLAGDPPMHYSEKASVVGHPNLLPVVITSGHFSGSKVVQVLTGFEPCDEEDMTGQFGVFCMLLGGKPVIRSYDAQLVTATIMPGSSGSAVYNSDDKLSGLVFAGSQDFGYGWIVPYASIANFLQVESPAIEPVKVGAFNPYTKGEEQSFQDYVKKIKQICVTDNSEKTKLACSYVKNLLFHQPVVLE